MPYDAAGRTRQMIVAAALVAAALLLGACSENQDGDQPKAEEKTCGYDETTLMPALKAGMTATPTVRMTMDMTAPGNDLEIDAVIAYTPKGVEMEMIYRGTDDEFAVVVVDGRYFIADSADGSYRELEPDDPAVAPLREQVEGMDMRSTFTAWDAGLEKVAAVGEEKIDGEPVCHYTLTVDAAKAFQANGEEPAPGMPDTIDYELHLTAEDLMRRVGFELGPVDAEMNATRWNEPVDIKVPAGH